MICLSREYVALRRVAVSGESNRPSLGVAAHRPVRQKVLGYEPVHRLHNRLSALRNHPVARALNANVVPYRDPPLPSVPGVSDMTIQS